MQSGTGTGGTSSAGPLVSVIIPVRDDAPRLRTCLQALGGQTLVEPFEIIVVDNGSARPPAEVVADHPSARLLHEDGTTSYAARNTGVAAANGRFLAFTDADCVPAGDWLQRGCERLLRSAPETFVGGRVDIFTAHDGPPNPFELYEIAHAFPQRHYVEVDGFAVTANLLVARELFLRIGPFDSSLASGGDAEWGRRATRLGARGVFADEVRVGHPARPSFRELRRKLRRTHAGAAAVRAERPGARQLLALARPPVRTIVRKYPKLPAPALRSRALYTGAAILMHYTGGYERLRAQGSRRSPPGRR